MLCFDLRDSIRALCARESTLSPMRESSRETSIEKPSGISLYKTFVSHAEKQKSVRNLNNSYVHGGRYKTVYLS